MLIFFILGMGLISFLLSDKLQLENVLGGIVLYLFCVPFIYFNHRWAIVVVCLMYLADKIVFIIQQIGAPISHIIFGLIVLSLSYRSYITATYLKKISKPD